jgi:hypothetical protein
VGQGASIGRSRPRRRLETVPGLEVLGWQPRPFPYLSRTIRLSPLYLGLPLHLDRISREVRVQRQCVYAELLAHTVETLVGRRVRRIPAGREKVDIEGTAVGENLKERTHPQPPCLQHASAGGVPD